MRTQSFTQRSTAVAVLLLLFVRFAAFGQIIHDNVYGTAQNDEEAVSMTPLRAGGYLLAGGYYDARPSRPHLYLLKLNADGDTVWTKKHFVRGYASYYPTSVVETASGQFLLTGYGYSFGNTQRDAFMAMLNARGDTLWTKRVFGFLNDSYFPPQLLPGGDFLVSGQLNSNPTLARYTDAGQLVWQQVLQFSPTEAGTVGPLLPRAGVVGQYWTPLGAIGSPYRLVGFDANGNFFGNLPPPTGLRGFRPVLTTATEYIFMFDNEIFRYDANFAPVANYAVGASGPLFNQFTVMPDGNFLIGGEYNNYRGVALRKFTPAGVVLKDTTFNSGPGMTFLKGLAVEPRTGDIVFAGYTTIGPIGRADIYWTQWRPTLVTSTRAARAAGFALQAYPNPLGTDGRLHLQAEQPLRGTWRLRDALGRELGRWAATGQPSQTLDLPARLVAGLYFLTLESDGEPPRTVRLVQP